MTDVSKVLLRPTAIVLHARSRVLEIAFGAAHSYRLPYELLRVYSPSAEVLGHGPGQEVLQTGKQYVNIQRIEPVGNYGIKPVFDDGHDSGIFAWDYLLHLGEHQERLWQAYLDRLQAAGGSRLPTQSAAMRTIPIRRADA